MRGPKPFRRWPGSDGIGLTEVYFSHRSLWHLCGAGAGLPGVTLKPGKDDRRAPHGEGCRRARRIRARDVTDACYSFVLNLASGITEEVAVGSSASSAQRRRAQSFETIVASGSLLPARTPARRRKPIEAGDLVLMDFGAIWHAMRRYHRTVAVGRADDRQREGLRGRAPGPGSSHRPFGRASRTVMWTR